MNVIYEKYSSKFLSIIKVCSCRYTKDRRDKGLIKLLYICTKYGFCETV